jgi:hypothetical protein
MCLTALGNGFAITVISQIVPYYVYRLIYRVVSYKMHAGCPDLIEAIAYPVSHQKRARSKTLEHTHVHITIDTFVKYDS